MFFMESPIASSLFLIMCSLEVHRPDRLRRALTDVAVFADTDSAVASVDVNNLAEFLMDRRNRRSQSANISVRKPCADTVAANHASIVDLLIDMRAYARLNRLSGLVNKLDGAIRIAAETFGPRDQSATLVLYPLSTEEIDHVVHGPLSLKRGLAH